MKKYLIPSTLLAVAALATPAFADEITITFEAQNNAPSGSGASDDAWTVNGTKGYYVGTNLSTDEYFTFEWGDLTDTDSGSEGVLMNQQQDPLDNGVVIPHTSTNYTLSFTITATEAIEISSIAFQFVGAFNGGNITNANGTNMDTSISLTGTQGEVTTTLASTTVTIYGTTLDAVLGTSTNETDIGHYEANYIVLNFDTITLEEGDSITFTLGVGGTGAMQAGIQSIVVTTPEPSMFGLMFGLGAIGLVATRRRRRA